MSTKAIQQIEERMAGLQPGTIRYQTLEAAKRFKSSWIELGRMLWTVLKEKKFREWGYLTFETYCAKEIGIKAVTAKKLLYSYSFLEREEPALLQRLTEDSPANLPSAESVNLLRLLKKRQESLPAQGYQQVRSYVLEKGKEAPEVRRQVRSLLEAAQPDPEAARAARRQASIRRMIGTLKAMRLELAAGKLVPGRLLTELEKLILKLEQAL